MVNKYIVLSLMTVSIALGGCSGDSKQGTNDEVNSESVFQDVVSPPATPGVGGSVYDTMVIQDTRFSTLRKAIDLAGLADILDDESNDFTVFAPDDAAFELLNTGPIPTALDALLDDRDALIRLLQYHVVAGAFDEVTLDAAAAVGLTLPTLIEGESLTITTDASSIVGLAVNGVDISTTDGVLEVAEGATTSGIVHTIVEVLPVPEAAGSITALIESGTLTPVAP